MHNQASSIEKNLAEAAEEYDAVERSKIVAAQAAVRISQAFFGD